MAASISHPVDSSVDESLTDRIERDSFLLGLLGVLGFLEYLQFVHEAFELAQLFYLFFLLFLVPPGLVVLSGLRDSVRSLYNRLTGERTEAESYYGESRRKPRASARG
jgi:hypothetical protein